MFRLILLSLLACVLAAPYYTNNDQSGLCRRSGPALYSQGCSSNVTVCNKFGREVFLFCPFGLVFDGPIEECRDRKMVAECSAVEQKGGSAVRTTEGLSASLCEGESDGFHSATDCSTSVIRCVNGVPKLLECPVGQVFDNTKYVCASPKDVPSCKDADESTTAAANECEGLSDGLFEKKACSHFFLTCSGGVSRIMSCPANLVFDKRFSICEYPGNVEGCSSLSGNGLLGECAEDGYFSYGNCSDLFYSCSNGRRIPMYCPAKLAFDESRQLCDYPAAVPVCNEEGSGLGSGLSPGESSGDGSEESIGEYFGEYSGEPSGEYSTEKSAEHLSDESGEYSGEASGEYSGEASGEYSGEALGEYSGEALGEYSGEALGEYSGEASGEYSGEASGEYSGEASGEYSGAYEYYFGYSDEISGELFYEASGGYEASGELSGNVRDLSSDEFYSSAVKESWDSIPEESRGSIITISVTLTSFCGSKADGFYASGCSPEMIACLDGQGTSMLCPAHMIYDEAKRFCEYPENVPCSKGEECSGNGPSAGGPCSNTFTNCVNGKAHHLSCENGYVFSAKHRTCIESFRVKECPQASSKPMLREKARLNQDVLAPKNNEKQPTRTQKVPVPPRSIVVGLHNKPPMPPAAAAPAAPAPRPKISPVATPASKQPMPAVAAAALKPPMPAPPMPTVWASPPKFSKPAQARSATSTFSKHKHNIESQKRMREVQEARFNYY